MLHVSMRRDTASSSAQGGDIRPPSDLIVFCFPLSLTHVRPLTHTPSLDHTHPHQIQTSNIKHQTPNTYRYIYRRNKASIVLQCTFRGYFTRSTFCLREKRLLLQQLRQWAEGSTQKLFSRADLQVSDLKL